MLRNSLGVGSINCQNKGMAIVRIVLGLLLIYHGQEVFNSKLMHEYGNWEQFKGSGALLKVYVGKSAELVAGILLLLGLYTRLGSLITILTFLFITFFVGQGRFWYEDQHPFLFALFGLVFFIYGPGSWSLDERLSKNKEQKAA